MKVLIKINKNALRIINRKKLNPEYRNMLNTNVISNDELVFSDAYIIENEKIVATFLTELIHNYNLNTISFQNIEVAKLFLHFIHKLKGIKMINFESDEVISYSLYKAIILNKEIKYLNAEYIPFYIFELLDKEGIVPTSRSEILFTSKFMSENNLSNYSSLFYKNTVFIKNELNENDIKDIDVFLQINKHLKIIHVYHINNDNLITIAKLLKENNHKNIKIIIHDDSNDKDLLDFLQKKKKSFKKEYQISLKLKYSDKFISDNIVSQTNNNILRLIGIMIIILICASFIYVFCENIISNKRINNIQNDIVNKVNNMDKQKLVDDIEQKTDKKVYNSYIAALQTINSDVKAWIKVNNTNIDYAVVQTDNNTYYLKHNIYKDKDNAGWLFADFQNTEDIDDNNIIYGHNHFHNGVMFGTLYKTMYKSWYTKDENQIITYDTLYGSYKFKIFSIYVTPVTSDYLVTNFNDSDTKIEFLKSIKEKSIYNFDVELNDTSKILTLSTCQSDTSRLVLHAVLVEENGISL